MFTWLLFSRFYVTISMHCIRSKTGGRWLSRCDIDRCIVAPTLDACSIEQHACVIDSAHGWEKIDCAIWWWFQKGKAALLLRSSLLGEAWLMSTNSGLIGKLSFMNLLSTVYNCIDALYWWICSIIENRQKICPHSGSTYLARLNCPSNRLKDNKNIP